MSKAPANIDSCEPAAEGCLTRQSRYSESSVSCGNAGMQSQSFPMATNLASLIDDRINNRISVEMKKVSQMLIENLSLFVKEATKLTIEQDVMPSLSKVQDNLTVVSRKLESQIR